jgi:hypothetical protein
MVKRLLFICIGLLPCLELLAQYAPAVGQPGSTAMWKDSSLFVGWANEAQLIRGLRCVSMPDSGYADVGDEQSALGKAGENGVVSLGDSGIITLSFQQPIINGPDYDFAVFENSFLDNFLELAFVEVSSNGEDFFRFPAHSLTQDSLQVSAFDLIEPVWINGLAGKYRALWGTPFDLDDVPDNPILNKQSITHIRLIDVVGSIDSLYATFDTAGNKINDPWPTPFPSSGFDLDAVGVIHALTGINESGQNGQWIYPNPVRNRLFFNYKDFYPPYAIHHPDGRFVLRTQTVDSFIDLSCLPSGIYIFSCFSREHELIRIKFVKEQ